jgi:hypothetical protein
MRERVNGVFPLNRVPDPEPLQPAGVGGQILNLQLRVIDRAIAVGCMNGYAGVALCGIICKPDKGMGKD